jgi:AraC family transcriptional regulator, positive regulator of tynA and feaB
MRVFSIEGGIRRHGFAGSPHMSKIQVISVEMDKYEDSLPQWGEALSTHVGRVSPLVRDQEVIRCSPIGLQRFAGRIEYGLLGDIVLAKLGAEPYSFSRSLRTATPTLPLPVLLLIQVSGSVRLAQHDRSCTLYPGDWSLLDTLHPFDSSSLGTPGEYQILGLERPSDPELLTLLEQGMARRFDSKSGLSRVLQFTLAETFNQMHCLKHQSKKSLQAAISAMTWDALREQLEGAPLIGRQHVRCARLKSYIESSLTNPELSLEGIAQACNTSVRSIHRAFAADPAGSVWKYIWQRRLSHCAAELRDPRHANRSITDICFFWGFNSSSHFSRLFSDQFGVPPSEYRSAVSYPGSPPSRHAHTTLAA